jgi:ryanodine receptor 2
MSESETIDTSAVVPDEQLRGLIERLARHVHATWENLRVADGWTHGPRRDDARKEHPSLVPYDLLPESEKLYDRRVVEETLKALIALGYRIEVAPDPESPASPEATPWATQHRRQPQG